LLEQCVAFALANNKASVAQEDAEQVAQRMVGMPVSLDTGFNALKDKLIERSLLTEPDINLLLDRLDVTMRNLDLRPSRPNLVVLLGGELAPRGHTIAEVIADSLFNNPQRIFSIDFSHLTEPHHVSVLLGSPPGYVGYAESTPFQSVVQTPWCVVLFEHIHSCHPQVREIITRLLSVGFLTDSRGKRIFLSDTIVLLTANVDQASAKPLGFSHEKKSAEPDVRGAIEGLLGPSLISQCDLVCTETVFDEENQLRWIRNHLLADLSKHYQRHRVHINWDSSLVEWLLSRHKEYTKQAEMERFLDEKLTPCLIPYLPREATDELRTLSVKFEDEKVQVEVIKTDDRR
jgi:ATP-dependent Clp protease ATP-binding subunit ClpA